MLRPHPITLLSLALVLLALPLAAAAEPPITFDFADGLHGWRSFKGNHGESTASLAEGVCDGQRVAQLSVTGNEAGNGGMIRELDLPEGTSPVIEIQTHYRVLELEGDRVQVVAEFRGGTAPGNNKWQVGDVQHAAGGWQRARLMLTAPADATKLRLRVMVISGGGEVAVRAVTVRRMEAGARGIERVRASAPESVEGKLLTPYHFGVQLVYWFPGAYDGTLPPDAPGSQRSQFVEKLRQIGARSVRFPGGTNSHFYFAESPEKTRELVRRLEAANTPNAQDSWPKGHYPRWQDVRDTLREAEAKIIYQLNTSFYLDEAGEIQPICDSKFPKQLGQTGLPIRAAEAAAALDRAFEAGIFRPGDVDYWEIGNEEPWKMEMAQYADIVAAFVKVLAKRDPGRSICYTGHWDIEPLLAERGVLELVSGRTFHYPYSRWPQPDHPLATADYEAFAQVDVGFTGHNDTFLRKQQEGTIPQHVQRSVSETSIYKYWTFDPFRMTCSYAHAMVFARNWPELIVHPVVDMAVFHDLESPFFGMMMYHASFSNTRRCFDWLPRGAKGKPVSNKQKHTYPHLYVPTPTAYVLGLMAQMEGSLSWRLEGTDKVLAGGLVGQSEDAVMLFIANPNAEPVTLDLAWPKSWGAGRDGTWQMLEASSYYAALEDEYSQRTIAAPQPQGGAVQLLLPPRSIQLVRWAK